MGAFEEEINMCMNCFHQGTASRGLLILNANTPCRTHLSALLVHQSPSNVMHFLHRVNYGERTQLFSEILIILSLYINI